MKNKIILLKIFIRVTIVITLGVWLNISSLSIVFAQQTEINPKSQTTEEKLDLPNSTSSPEIKDSSPEPLKNATNATNSEVIVSKIPKQESKEIKTENVNKPDLGGGYSKTEHDPKTSIMFSSEEMEIVEKILKIYDNQSNNDKTTNHSNEAEDLSDIFKNAVSEPPSKNEAKPIGYNISLSSIIYHSTAEWLVIINGKKISSKDNNRNNEIYIDKISRKEVEILWKPKNINEIISKIHKAEEKDKRTLLGISIDKDGSKICLILKPNQTFMSSEITIREGVIRP